MRLSSKKRQELYNCIHKNITDLRIQLKLDEQANPEYPLDYKLAQLEHPIWRDIKRVLNIE